MEGLETFLGKGFWGGTFEAVFEEYMVLVFEDLWSVGYQERDWKRRRGWRVLLRVVGVIQGVFVCECDS